MDTPVIAFFLSRYILIYFIKSYACVRMMVCKYCMHLFLCSIGFVEQCFCTFLEKGVIYCVSEGKKKFVLYKYYLQQHIKYDHLQALHPIFFNICRCGKKLIPPIVVGRVSSILRKRKQVCFLTCPEVACEHHLNNILF